MIRDENSAPNNFDPMAMLLEAKMESIHAYDQKIATQIAAKLEEEKATEDEQMKVVLMAQSEEDVQALQAEQQEMEDMRVAKEFQDKEEKEALDKESKLKAQLEEDEGMAKKMNNELAKQAHDIALKGDVKGMEELIKKGVDPALLTQNVEERPSPLMVSVSKKNLALVNTFLNVKGVDLNHADAKGNTALHRAAELNKVDIIEALADAGAKLNIKNNNQHTPIMLAAKAGHFEPIAVLIKHGADLYLKDGQNKMALQLVPMLSIGLRSKLEGMMGWKLLEYARKGKGDDVMALIEKGASPFLSDDKNMTALHHAALGGHNIVCEFLLTHRAKVNAQDINGETPLHKAAQAGAGAVWTTLIKKGADPEIKNKAGLVAADQCNSGFRLLMNLTKRRSPSKLT